MGRREDLPNMYIYDCFVNKCGRKKKKHLFGCENVLRCWQKKKNFNFSILKQSIHSSRKIHKVS